MMQRIEILKLLRGNGENVAAKLQLLKTLPEATAQCLDAELEVKFSHL